MNNIKLAKYLGWFSLGLGMVECVAPGRVNRLAGLQVSRTLLRLFGVREMVAGLWVLKTPDSACPVWARAAGDALDAVVLASALVPGSARRCRTMTALAGVAAIAMVDVACARSLRHRSEQARATARRTRIR